MKKLDLLKKRFGQLEVISLAGSDSFGHSLWRCKCDCGNEKVVMGDHLRRGLTGSCGCYSGMRTHGMYKSPEYYAYEHAKARCQNPSAQHYESYGGRGIKFLFESFEDFFRCVGTRPVGLSLDRIDNNGHYEPGNLRWATRKEQLYNKRKSIDKLMRTIAWG